MAAPALATLGRIDAASRGPISHFMTESDLTVYHDGSCPLCRMEINHYRRQGGAERIRFVDVTDRSFDDSFDLGPDLARDDAMGRFHARLPSGELRSGAAAFVEIWRLLPRWRPVAMLARLPGAMPALEVGYRLFAPARPHLARAVSRLGLA